MPALSLVHHISRSVSSFHTFISLFQSSVSIYIFVMRILMIITSVIIIISSVLIASVWTDITNPDCALVLSNVWESSVYVVGKEIKTNNALDLSTIMTREDINRNIWFIYTNILNGKLTYNTNGCVPVRSF